MCDHRTSIPSFFLREDYKFTRQEIFQKQARIIQLFFLALGAAAYLGPASFDKSWPAVFLLLILDALISLMVHMDRQKTCLYTYLRVIYTGHRDKSENWEIMYKHFREREKNHPLPEIDVRTSLSNLRRFVNQDALKGPFALILIASTIVIATVCAAWKTCAVEQILAASCAVAWSAIRLRILFIQFLVLELGMYAQHCTDVWKKVDDKVPLQDENGTD